MDLRTQRRYNYVVSVFRGSLLFGLRIAEFPTVESIVPARNVITRSESHMNKTIPVPMTIGHEFVGVIAEVGSNVHDFTPGMLVSGEGHVVCGRCRNCLAGRRHLCARTYGVGVNRPGAFAEYVSLPVTNVWAADPQIPLEVLSSFDPLGNATHCALSFSVLGEDVLITGAGPIGLMAIAIAKHAGARYVVVTDLNRYRLDLAKAMVLHWAEA